MKKILLTIMISLLLVGCSGTGDPNLSDSDTTIITVGDQAITKGHVFTMMKNQGLESTIIDLAKVTLIDSLVEVDETVEARAQELLKENKEYFGDSFHKIIEQSFESEEQFVEQQLIPAVKQEIVAREYYDEFYDEIVEEQKPRQVQIITTKTSSDGSKVINGLKDGDNIDELIEEFGTDDASSDFVIIAETSTIPATVKAFIQEAESGDLTQEPIPDTQSGNYFVVKVIETDANKLQDEYFDIFMISTTNLEKVFQHYFKKYDFKVYDQRLYNRIKNSTTVGEYTPNN